MWATASLILQENAHLAQENLRLQKELEEPEPRGIAPLELCFG